MQGCLSWSFKSNGQCIQYECQLQEWIIFLAQTLITFGLVVMCMLYGRKTISLRAPKKKVASSWHKRSLCKCCTRLKKKLCQCTCSQVNRRKRDTARKSLYTTQKNMQLPDMYTTQSNVQLPDNVKLPTHSAARTALQRSVSWESNTTPRFQNTRVGEEIPLGATFPRIRHTSNTSVLTTSTFVSRKPRRMSEVTHDPSALYTEPRKLCDIPEQSSKKVIPLVVYADIHAEQQIQRPQCPPPLPPRNHE